MTSKRKNNRTIKKSRRPFSASIRNGPLKANPFDLRVNHKKYNYIGRDRKGKSGRPTESRSKAIEERSRRILRGIEVRQRNNRFEDKRLRASDEDGSDALLRLQKLKMVEASDIAMADRTFGEYDVINRLGGISNRLDESDSDEETARAMEGIVMASNARSETDSALALLIEESKKAKEERIQEKDEVVEATERSNAEWESLRPAMRFRAQAAIARMPANDEYDSFLHSLRFSRQASRTHHTEDRTAFETRAQYVERMECLRVSRMNVVCAKQFQHTNPDELACPESEPMNATSEDPATNANPSFLTELSHATPSEVLSTLPQFNQSYDEFVKCCLTERSLSQLLTRCNPLNNDGCTDLLRRLVEYLLRAFMDCSTKDEFPVLLILGRSLQTVLYHYREAVEPKLLRFLESYCTESEMDIERIKQLNSVLRLISRLYSITDFAHAIGAPALKAATRVLWHYATEKLPISMAHFYRMLITCEILTDYIEEPCRYLPEVILFLQYAIDVNLQNRDCSASNHTAMGGPSVDHLLDKTPDVVVEQLDAMKVVNIEEAKNRPIGILSRTIRFREKLILFACSLYRRHINITSKLPGRTWVLNKSSEFIDGILKRERQRSVQTQAKCPCSPSLEEISNLLKTIGCTSSLKHDRLTLPSNSIRMHTPKLISRYCDTTNESQLERNMKVRRKVKKELRCTAREIRRESNTLAELKLARQKKLDEERVEKVKRIMCDLADQEGNYRKSKRAK